MGWLVVNWSVHHDFNTSLSCTSYFTFYCELFIHDDFYYLYATGVSRLMARQSRHRFGTPQDRNDIVLLLARELIGSFLNLYTAMGLCTSSDHQALHITLIADCIVNWNICLFCKGSERVVVKMKIYRIQIKLSSWCTIYGSCDSMQF